MPKSNDVKLQTLLDNLKVVTAVTPPSGSQSVYLALYVTSPGSGNTGTEVSYSGYARQEITFGDPAINGANAEIKNTNLIEFATVPVASGSFAHIAILSALTGGTLLYYGALGSTYTLGQGVKPSVPIGSLTVYES